EQRGRPMTTLSNSAGSDPLGHAKVVELTLELSKRSYATGEPIHVRSAIRNGTDQEVTIWLSGFWPNHRVVVTDVEDHEPAFTTFGRSCRDAFAPGGGRDKNVALKLRPGESYAAGPKCDLNALYRFKPGRYHLAITYEDLQGPTPLKVTSKVAAFDI